MVNVRLIYSTFTGASFSCIYLFLFFVAMLLYIFGVSMLLS